MNPAVTKGVVLTAISIAVLVTVLIWQRRNIWKGILVLLRALFPLAKALVIAILLIIAVLALFSTGVLSGAGLIQYTLEGISILVLVSIYFGSCHGRNRSIQVFIGLLIGLASILSWIVTTQNEIQVETGLIIVVIIAAVVSQVVSWLFTLEISKRVFLAGVISAIPALILYAASTLL